MYNNVIDAIYILTRDEIGYVILSLVILCIFVIGLYLQLICILNSLAKIIQILKLKKPGLVFISLNQGEDGMLKFVLVLPEPSASDVVAREVKFSVGDQVFDLALAGDVVETPEMSGNDNDQVVGTLVDVDDAGNKSEAREFTFTLVDTLAPPQPGELGLKVTGEE